MQNAKYVVNNQRQKNYLYSLGFDFITQRDKFDSNKDVWIFDRTKELEEAIDFYCKFRSKMKNIVS